jgi:hypothetical protein
MSDETVMHTPGPWRAVAQGGSSTVVCPSKPRRNDTRIPAYGYDESNGHCVGYPFINDDGSTRLDFVDFSHADARLIAAAPELLAALKSIVPAFNTARIIMQDKEARDLAGEIVAEGRAAIAKAEGRS